MAEKKIRLTLRMYFFLFMLYSVIGWVYETILFSASEKKFVNRGFNFGPYIPIYGFGAVLIILVIRFFIRDSYKIKGINVRPFVIFVVFLILATLAELVGSLLIEKIFGVMLWDYSDDWMNFQGRIAVRPSLNFGIGGLIVFYTAQPFGRKLINKVGVKGQRIFALILLLVLGMDFASSAIIIKYYPEISKAGVLGKK